MLFSQPAFLWGLLALAIPVIVHLFNFRRYRKVYFSNVDRLSELHSEQRRRHTLKQWLVLAMRVLAVTFLVLAFAQPVLVPATGEKEIRQGSSAVSIYIDNSFSMENAGAEGSLLDAARRKAREVAEAYSVGDRYQLITNDMAGSEMRWLNRDELYTALDEVEPSPAAPLMSAVATRQIDFMRQSALLNRHAYIISDFQQSTADLDRLLTVREEVSDSNVLFTLVPLGTVEADNLYVDSVTLDAPAYFVGGTVRVEVVLRNSGGRDAEKVPVKLLVDGRERAVTTVDIASDATAQTTLAFPLDHAGWIDGSVVIEDYPVTFDDNYHFTFHVGDRIHVLQIDGDKPNENLRRLFAADTSIEYQQARHLQHDLAQYDFVILNESRSLASGEVQQLSQWVTEGGTLLAVPSVEGVKDLNVLLASLHAPQLDRWVRRTVKSTAVDYGSALYRGVFVGRNEEMEMPTLQGHYTHDRSQCIKQSVISLADGGDMLSITPSGEGRLYLFTTPLTGEYTDFVNQALFVPTLYNMALYSRPLPPVAYTLGGDSPVALQGEYDLNARPPELTDGGQVSLLPDLRRVGNRRQLVLHGELKHDGIYTLGEEHLAFNYPRRESLMTFFERDAIAKAIDGQEGYTMVRNSAKPLTDELRARDGGRPLWRLCILLALLALAGEMALLKIRIKIKN